MPRPRRVPSSPKAPSISPAVKQAELAAVKHFFRAKEYAVVGASAHADKWGHKIFQRYLERELRPVYPINPYYPSIHMPNLCSQETFYDCIPSISKLPTPTLTSISIVTPPSTTLSILAEARKAEVRSVWLQPGSYDEKCEALLKEDEAFWKGRWIGPGMKAGSLGEEGWCVLTDGEEGLRIAREKDDEGEEFCSEDARS